MALACVGRGIFLTSPKCSWESIGKVVSVVVEMVHDRCQRESATKRKVKATGRSLKRMPSWTCAQGHRKADQSPEL